MEITKLTRVFAYNGMELADPGESFSPEDVKQIYAATFPEITAAGIEGPVTKENKLVYTFHRAIGTKGNGQVVEPEVQRMVTRAKKVDGLTYLVVKPQSSELGIRDKAKIAAEKLGLLLDRILFYPPAC